MQHQDLPSIRTEALGLAKIMAAAFGKSGSIPNSNYEHHVLGQLGSVITVQMTRKHLVTSSQKCIEM